MENRTLILQEAKQYAESHYSRNHCPKNWNDRYQAHIAGRKSANHEIAKLESELQSLREERDQAQLDAAHDHADYIKLQSQVSELREALKNSQYQVYQWHAEMSTQGKEKPAKRALKRFNDNEELLSKTEPK